MDLHVLEWGVGPARPLLLIAGIPAIAEDWSVLAARLGAGRRVVAYDNRGSGGSPVTPGPYTTRQLAADGVAVLDHLNIERADVLGVSMGGMIAQELALGWPERVGRLVLGCTHAGFRHAIQPGKDVGRAFALQTDDWGQRIRALAPFAFARGTDPGFLEAFIAKKSRDVQPAEGYQAEHETLVLTGDDDRVIPAANSEVLAERIPGARLRVLAGRGHLFFLEDPDEAAGVIGPFLDGS